MMKCGGVKQVYCCEKANCGAKFKTRQGFREHERTHSKVFPYLCRIPGCGVRLRWRSSLAHHERKVHSRSTEFQTKSRLVRKESENTSDMTSPFTKINEVFPPGLEEDFMAYAQEIYSCNEVTQEMIYENSTADAEPPVYDLPGQTFDLNLELPFGAIVDNFDHASQSDESQTVVCGELPLESAQIVRVASKPGISPSLERADFDLREAQALVMEALSFALTT